MKPSLRKIALERMHILINSAISNAKMNPDLSQRQASIARRISTRHKIRMPYELRIVFCKKCKSFIAPGINSRIRLGRVSVKSIRITCNLCGHTYRKIILQSTLDVNGNIKASDNIKSSVLSTGKHHEITSGFGF